MERADAETEPRAEEQEEKPDTEHEDVAIEKTEPKELFGLQNEIDQTVLERMTNLAEILMRGSQETQVYTTKKTI
jgi:hypothetical protein